MAVSVKIEDELKSRIQRLAQSRRRSAHWLMREAIEQYVEREEARVRFKAEADAAWSAYQEAGMHLTGKEALDWLGSWGTEHETEAPACHD